MAAANVNALNVDPAWRPVPPSPVAMFTWLSPALAVRHSARHRLHLAGCHVDGYDGGVQVVGHVRALVVHRRLRRVLQLGVERGVDGQSAFEQVGIRASVGVVLVEQQRTHVAGEKGIGVDAVGWCVGRRVQPQLLGLGIVVLLLRDVAGRQHAVEHHVAARQGRRPGYTLGLR